MTAAEAGASLGAPLAGRVSLVTGASRGIGQATAVALAEAGSDVIVHYHRTREGAEETAQRVTALGRRAELISADLEDADAIGRLFDTVGERFGALDVLVLNAAATAFKSSLAVQPHHLERTYNLVVRSLVLSIQRAVPLMRAHGAERPVTYGRIITVSGHGTPFTLPNYGVLGSAKAAVEAWTRYFAYDLGPEGITVNCVAPGVIDTDSARYYFKDAFARFDGVVAQQTPLRRMGRPEDVAAAVVFFAGPGAAFVTGSVLRVDGGISLTSGPFEAFAREAEQEALAAGAPPAPASDPGT